MYMRAQKNPINPVYFCTTKMLDAALNSCRALTDFIAFRRLAAG